MSLGEFLTRWTVRVALACYFAAVVLRWRSNLRPSPLSLSRVVWTFGCIAFLLHLVCAFHFYHHWSHDHAYAVTAEQTEEAIGLNWGGGIYVNHIFAVVWVWDVLWWWVAPTTYERRPRWIEWAVQGFMAFIAFNATVVFGHGAIRWFGIAATLVLAVVLFGKVRAGLSRRRGPMPTPLRPDESPNR